MGCLTSAEIAGIRDALRLAGLGFPAEARVILGRYPANAIATSALGRLADDGSPTVSGSALQASILSVASGGSLAAHR